MYNITVANREMIRLSETDDSINFNEEHTLEELMYYVDDMKYWDNTMYAINGIVIQYGELTHAEAEYYINLEE